MNINVALVYYSLVYKFMYDLICYKKRKFNIVAFNLNVLFILMHLLLLVKIYNFKKYALLIRQVAR